MTARLEMVEASNDDLSLRRQCNLLNLTRSTYYYKAIPESEDNLILMKEIDMQYLDTPAYGIRLMTAHLKRRGFLVNHKRVARLMRRMGIKAMYPKPKRDTWKLRYGKFPYLLKNMEIAFPNQVWGTDITYIPVEDGFLYLVAVIDLYSRFVLSWQLSDSLESGFCIKALEEAFLEAKPRILNSDQGVQFTSHEYVDLIRDNEVEISMSGQGRCWDNIFVERFWRSLKYEEVYLKQYNGPEEAYEGIAHYIDVYNYQRPHSALSYRTPWEAYQAA